MIRHATFPDGGFFSTRNHLVGLGFQVFQHVFGHAVNGPLRRQRLQQKTNLENILQIMRVQQGDPPATSGQAHQQAILAQPLGGPPDGRRIDSQLGGKRPLLNSFARLEIAVKDSFQNDLVTAIGLVGRIERQVARHFLPRRISNHNRTTATAYFDPAGLDESMKRLVESRSAYR